MAIDGPTGSNATPETQAPDQTGEENKQPSGTPGHSASTKIGNLANLRKEAPEVYKKMLEAMFQEIQKQDQKSQARLKKMHREGS